MLGTWHAMLAKVWVWGLGFRVEGLGFRGEMISKPSIHVLQPQARILHTRLATCLRLYKKPSLGSKVNSVVNIQRARAFRMQSLLCTSYPSLCCYLRCGGREREREREQHSTLQTPRPDDPYTLTPKP